jgi:voltage-gated potassium channel Kch
MAKGAPALIAWLMVVTTAMLLIAAAVVVIAGIAPEKEDGAMPTFGQMLWRSLMRTLDPGNLDGDTGSKAYLGAMFAMTMAGIFVVSILIGLITSGIESKLEELRKGRSVVCEEDHTVVLGWSEQIFSILSELSLANESRKRAAIAILADKDKVEMEDEIAAKVPDLRGTRVVCRTGSPLVPDDLVIVRPAEARSIIVLAPEEGDPDAHVIKTILALTNGERRKQGKYHIVAEIRDERNMEAAKLVGCDEAELLVTEDLLARITVQTSRQAGLSTVYTELLDFGGDEIYMTEQPGLVGKTFGEAMFAFETSSVIGLRRKVSGVQLLPPMDSRIEAGDQVIVIAEDDDAIHLAEVARSKIDEQAIRSGPLAPPQPERTLVLGWNRRGATILRELDAYVAEGSHVKVVATTDAAAEPIQAIEGALARLTVTFEQADTTDRRVLDRLTAEPYDHVITLSYAEELEAQAADARTLITLLHLRDIESKRGDSFSIVSEMLDVRNRKLAEVTHADDFIVSDKLVSLMLAQVSENKDLAAVFADLFDPEGAKIYFTPVSGYVELGKPLTFATVLESARRRGEIAIGYRIASRASDPAAAYGIKVNPPKSSSEVYGEADRLVLVAES